MKSKKRVRNDDGPRHVTPAGRSVFFDLFEAEEAMELEVRATLLHGLERWLTDSGMTQTEAAKALRCHAGAGFRNQARQDQPFQHRPAVPPGCQGRIASTGEARRLIGRPNGAICTGWKKHHLCVNSADFIRGMSWRSLEND